MFGFQDFLPLQVSLNGIDLLVWVQKKKKQLGEFSKISKQ